MISEPYLVCTPVYEFVQLIVMVIVLPCVCVYQCLGSKMD